MPRTASDPPSELLDLKCACAATRRAARALTYLYDSYLREHGIEAAQFALLNVIDRMGPCSQVQLGRALGMDKTTLSRNVRVLARAGWIDLLGSSHTRNNGLSVTVAGRRVLSASRPAWQAAQAAMKTAMTPTKWQAAHATLRHLAEAARHASVARGRQ